MFYNPVNHCGYTKAKRRRRSRGTKAKCKKQRPRLEVRGMERYNAGTEIHKRRRQPRAVQCRHVQANFRRRKRSGPDGMRLTSPRLLYDRSSRSGSEISTMSQRRTAHCSPGPQGYGPQSFPVWDASRRQDFTQQLPACMMIVGKFRAAAEIEIT